MGPKIEYLQRELRWVHVEDSKVNSESLPKLLVILVGQDLTEVLRLFRIRQKVFVYLYADETYRLAPSLLLFLNPKVQRILRSYPIHDLEYRHISRKLRQILSAYRNQKLSQKSEGLSIIVSVCAGLIIGLRQSLLNILEKLRFGNSTESLWLPLGYTNKFARSFCKKFEIQDGSRSFIESRLLSNLSEISKKSLQFVFRGQRGTYQRQSFIRSCQDVDLGFPKSIEVQDKFGGGDIQGEIPLKGEDPYVRELCLSAFALCPPGNYSLETFRYWEALLCRCLPIVTDLAFSDPLRRGLGLKLNSMNHLFSTIPGDALGSSLEKINYDEVARWRERLDRVNVAIFSS